MQALFNILAICGSAGFSGVMICIGVTLGGYWRTLPPQDFLNWFAANNQFVAMSVPVIVGPALIGLIGSVWMAWNTPTQMLWVLSTLCLIGVIILTAAYFVPTNNAFANGTIDPADVAAKLNQWLSIHYARIGIAMLGAVLGCVALRG